MNGEWEELTNAYSTQGYKWYQSTTANSTQFLRSLLIAVAQRRWWHKLVLIPVAYACIYKRITLYTEYLTDVLDSGELQIIYICCMVWLINHSSVGYGDQPFRLVDYCSSEYNRTVQQLQWCHYQTRLCLHFKETLACTLNIRCQLVETQQAYTHYQLHVILL